MQLEDDDPNPTLVDGGLGANNPSMVAWESIKQYSGNDLKAVDINVSIGTGGIVNKASRWGPMKKLYFLLNTINQATDSFSTHEASALNAQENGFGYYWLNVEGGFGNMNLDTWKGKGGVKILEEIRNKTGEYLKSDEVQIRLKESAEYLVKKRQQRSKHHDGDRWERYWHGVEYQCE